MTTAPNQTEASHDEQVPTNSPPRLWVSATLVALAMICVFQLIFIISLQKSLARNESGAGVSQTAGLDSQRLQNLEREIADLRKLNDKILSLAGIHRPLPEDTRESDKRAIGDWSLSAPIRTPRIGVLSRGFRSSGGSLAHPGVDIPGPAGVPIRAAGGGIVVRAELDLHYGNVVTLDHGENVQSLYAHNEELLVSLGDSVWSGQTIARLGSTGRSTAPHLHFEILVGGIAIDPGDYVREYRKLEDK